MPKPHFPDSDDLLFSKDNIITPANPLKSQRFFQGPDKNTVENSLVPDKYILPAAKSDVASAKKVLFCSI
ncbi:MAG: hypothetical protein Q4E24_09870 [bacterium]|nr:hypothetical protein [bacterium]